MDIIARALSSLVVRRNFAMAGVGFVPEAERDTIAQAADFPTVDINIDRERAGQFGLTMSDVVRSVVPATSSSRFTQPNYWRDPASGNAFQIQLQLPQNQMQSVENLGQLPVMQNGRSQPRLTDVAAFKLGTMPGLIERYNGQHVVSLTANLHGPTLGEAVVQINRAIAAAGAPPKGVTVKLRGEAPALEQTLSGLRLGLLLAVLVIFLLLSANFQSVRLALAIVLSTIALAWNYVFNGLFEAWESRQAVKGRSFRRRLAHGIGFEGGLVFLLVPVMAYWLETTLLKALLADLGILAFFFVYAIVFTWAFDKVFGLPQSAGGPCEA